MTGHIKLDRKILSWEWYNDANTFRVFVHLLLMATHKDGRYRGYEVKRGEVVTGRLKLASTLGLSENEVRRSLDKLKSTGEITSRITNRFSIVTICKYDVYQSIKNDINQQNNQQSAQQRTNSEPTANQPLTTFNNVKNDNNVKNVSEYAPEKKEVERVFLQQGGTIEMAETFFNKHSAVAWFANGQPIKEFNFLVPSFIKNWHEIKNSKNGTSNRTSNSEFELSYDRP